MRLLDRRILHARTPPPPDPRLLDLRAPNRRRHPQRNHHPQLRWQPPKPLSRDHGHGGQSHGHTKRSAQGEGGADRAKDRLPSPTDRFEDDFVPAVRVSVRKGLSSAERGRGGARFCTGFRCVIAAAVVVIVVSLASVLAVYFLRKSGPLRCDRFFSGRSVEVAVVSSLCPSWYCP